MIWSFFIINPQFQSCRTPIGPERALSPHLPPGIANRQELRARKDPYRLNPATTSNFFVFSFNFPVFSHFVSVYSIEMRSSRRYFVPLKFSIYWNTLCTFHYTFPIIACECVGFSAESLKVWNKCSFLVNGKSNWNFNVKLCDSSSFWQNSNIWTLKSGEIKPEFADVSGKNKSKNRRTRMGCGRWGLRYGTGIGKVRHGFIEMMNFSYHWLSADQSSRNPLENTQHFLFQFLQNYFFGKFQFSSPNAFFVITYMLYQLEIQK